MTRLSWDDQDRQYESGVDRGVFYPPTGPGEVWNGLISVTETPTELSSQTRYQDGVKVQNRRNSDSFSATIEAFTYPESFYTSILTNLHRSAFGFSYRVKTADTYKIHVVYNATANPTSKNYEQSELTPYSWFVTTKPTAVTDAMPSAHLVVDGTQAHAWAVSAFEDILYGNDVAAARLPSPVEAIDIFEEQSILRVISYPDGTFTVTGPDEAITMLDPTTFEITWPTAIYIDAESYKISSL